MQTVRRVQRPFLPLPKIKIYQGSRVAASSVGHIIAGLISMFGGVAF